MTQDGQIYAVYLYYYWKGKQIRRSLDFFVAQKDWNQCANGGAGEFRPSYGPNYKERNAYLKEFMHDIDSKIMDYIKQHGEIDGETIEAFVNGDKSVLRADHGELQGEWHQLHQPVREVPKTRASWLAWRVSGTTLHWRDNRTACA